MVQHLAIITDFRIVNIVTDELVLLPDDSESVGHAALGLYNNENKKTAAEATVW